MPTDFRSLEIHIPDTAPYDKQDSWFPSFIGTDIAPIIGTGEVKRFWFTRYGAVGQGKSAKFRFETADLRSTIEPMVQTLIKKYPSPPADYVPYDHIGDVGGRNARFLGQNISPAAPTPDERGERAFDFLHAAARLYLHFLSGPDPHGYYSLEPETTSGYNRESAMESYHHLFCNMTGVLTEVMAVETPNKQYIVEGVMYAALLVSNNGCKPVSTPIKVRF